MSFQIQALESAAFQHLFGLSEAQLAQLGARRYQVDSFPGFPCRLSLTDLEPGQTALLLSFPHLQGDTPYRSEGPIFIGEQAETARIEANNIPAVLTRRPISVRAYDRDGWMRHAEVIEGETPLRQQIEHYLDDSEVEFLHLHYARRGCYAARVVRG